MVGGFFLKGGGNNHLRTGVEGSRGESFLRKKKHTSIYILKEKEMLNELRLRLRLRLVFVMMGMDGGMKRH